MRHLGYDVSVRVYIVRMKQSVVVSYKLSGEKVSVYASAKEASLKKKMHPRSIDKCLRGDTFTAKNLQWRRFPVDEVPERIEPYVKKKVATSFQPIAKVNQDGLIIETYPSIKKASKLNHLDPHSIRDILKGKYKESNKVKFRYLTDKEIKEYGYKVGETYNIEKKAVIQLSLDDVYLRSYSSIGEAAKALNKPRQGIVDCLSGKYSTAYSYKWKYRDLKNIKRKRSPLIYQYSQSGELIKKHKSVKDASLSTGISIGSINNVLCHRQKTAGGFIFKRK